MVKKTRIEMIQDQNLKDKMDLELDAKMLLPKPRMEHRDAADIKLIPSEQGFIKGEAVRRDKKKDVQVSPGKMVIKPRLKERKKDNCVIL